MSISTDGQRYVTSTPLALGFVLPSTAQLVASVAGRIDAATLDAYIEVDGFSNVDGTGTVTASLPVSIMGDPGSGMFKVFRWEDWGSVHDPVHRRALGRSRRRCRVR